MARPMQDDEHGAVNPAIQWRGTFANAELNALHAECFEHRIFEDDWWAQVKQHSLGWVCLRHVGNLIGFANVAWDGGVHAFLVDVLVSSPFRHRGFATAIVEEAVQQARAAGCEWLHVDFEPHLREFYLGRCGFRHIDAGLIALR